VSDFAGQMARLDALLAECVATGAFGDAAVRDISNRSGRDWPWWGVAVTRTTGDGIDRRRIAAELTLHPAASGVPATWHASWGAREWRDVGTDDFRQNGDWTPEWTEPTAADLAETMHALLAAADRAVPEAGAQG